MLDCVILGATEVDVDFNVNVNTESNGYLLHNTGGHCDTAAGAKLAIVVAPVHPRAAADRPGRGDDHHDAGRDGRRGGDRARHRGGRPARGPQEGAAAAAPAGEGHPRSCTREIYALTGTPRPLEFEDKVVALIEYRDGSIIDVVRQVRN